MKLTRRTFLQRSSVASAALPLLGACSEPIESDHNPPNRVYDYSGELGPESTFEHGVASGDPSSFSLIIWTRISLAPENKEERPQVWWEVSDDEGFENQVEAGWINTGAERDFTVKVLVSRLRPGKTYYYRFSYLGRTSSAGITKTTGSQAMNQVRFGVVSCSNYRRGYFHAYHNLALRDDLDAILHLGDYFYESGGRGEVEGRDHEPAWDLVELEDYRARFSQYRKDKDLQELHRKLPFIVVWDDHESSNNAYEDGAGGHSNSVDGDWSVRKAASVRAYFEWLPIRETEPGKIWRTIRFGGLVDLFMLDTRLWGRDQHITNKSSLDDPRSLLGLDQENWIYDELRASTAQWKVLGQQVMMAQLKAVAAPNSGGGGAFLNNDQWDGYRGARKRLFDTIQDGNVENIVVLTGDIHSSWANELSQDPNNEDVYDPETSRGAVGVEFVAPGVTSTGLADLPSGIIELLENANPHIKYYDVVRQGYIVLELSKEHVQADFHHIGDVQVVEPDESISASFRALSGTNHLESTDEPIGI